MAIAVGALERDVLELLQKSPGHSGYYTEQKLRTAVQECFDFVSTMMFDAEYGGWLDDIRYITTEDGQAVISIPSDLAQIKVLRYKINQVYVPLVYDKEERTVQTDPSDSTVGQDNVSYRIFGDSIYFNPGLFEGGTNYLQIEGTFYPEKFTSKLDKLGPIWNRCFLNFIKYRSASILVSHKRDWQPPWQRFEQQWEMETRKLIGKRVNTVSTIKEFEG